MPVGHQANSAQDLQHSHFGLDVVLAEALGDSVDAHGVGQYMGSALGVVHQGFDAADDGGMYAALWGFEVHAPQEVQKTRQAIQLYESRHKPEGRDIKGLWGYFFQCLEC